ncbi:hypothetical protein GCM10009760_22210 [Kitasatospora kazusensis]|uniref:SRPBCC domain-containing protein n=1 Tax=Kitasatospora kazusensis TaxID=407974 RepID=A0ABN2ZBC1_9ACTN
MTGRLTGLFRTGPSLAVLDREYARAGRVDPAAPIQARHRVTVDAPAAEVWRLITDVGGWPRWCAGVHEVRVDGPELRPGTEFRWRNGKNRIRSTVSTLIPGREISWTGVCSGARAVRRHLLTPAPDGGGTLLTVEESMSGFLLPVFYDSGKLQTATGAWLEALRKTAEREWRDGIQPDQPGSPVPT